MKYIPDMYLDELGKKIYTGEPLTDSEIEFIKGNYQKMLKNQESPTLDEMEKMLLESLETHKCFTPNIFARKHLKLIQKVKAIAGVSIVLIFLIWMFM